MQPKSNPDPLHHGTAEFEPLEVLTIVLDPLSDS